MNAVIQATAATILQKSTINFRLILVCLAAASVGLPVAIVSIAKVLLILGGVALLIFSRIAVVESEPKIRFGSTEFAVAAALALFAVSLAWTSAPMEDALGSLNKYGKLLMIPLIAALIQNRKEAICALIVFALVQLFLAVGSWMLFFHMPVTWATSRSDARFGNAVFSSYLDQGIMTAVFASVCWHCRSLSLGRFGRHIAIAVVVLALFNVFFALRGRTGHLVAITLISLAIMWELPRKFRIGIIFLPVILMLGISVVSPKVRERAIDVKTELQNFSFKEGASVAGGSSSGIRLHFWHRAIQSIADRPLMGAGIGSWSSEFNRLEKEKKAVPDSIAPMGNPHQEYLLWGVQLGVPGILLLLVFFAAIFRDTQHMDEMSSRVTRSVLVALMIACLFNSVIYDALIGDFFCVTLGLLIALGRLPNRVDRKIPVNGQLL